MALIHQKRNNDGDNHLSINLIHLLDNIHKIPPNGLRDLMGKILSNHPNVNWEIGPDYFDSKLTILAFSLLSDNKELADFTQKIGIPKKAKKWRIQLGLPPRNWDMYFEYTDIQKSLIEGKKWLWYYSDSELGMNITFVPNKKMPKKIENNVACILANGELGERNINKYHITHDISYGECEKTLPMIALRKFFIERYPNCYYRKIMLEEQRALLRGNS